MSSGWENFHLLVDSKNGRNSWDCIRTKPEARNSIYVTCQDCRGPYTWSTILYLPRSIIRDLVQKHSSQDSNQTHIWDASIEGISLTHCITVTVPTIKLFLADVLKKIPWGITLLNGIGKIGSRIRNKYLYPMLKSTQNYK